jgi:predicted TIM-barrel fold metal-dependent hydrolase
MIEDHDHLWLDTTMTLGRYLPVMEGPPLSEFRSDRIMFGTDFPSIPYAWDRELNGLMGQGLSPEALERILGKNAREFFSISP